jgi:hypothetical protein
MDELLEQNSPSPFLFVGIINIVTSRGMWNRLIDVYKNILYYASMHDPSCIYITEINLLTVAKIFTNEVEPILNLLTRKQ